MINNLEWGAIMYLAYSDYGSDYYTSSTGNLYGVYDISSQLWEKVKGSLEVGSATKELLIDEDSSWFDNEFTLENSEYYLRNGLSYKAFSNTQEYKTRYVFLK